MTYSVLKVPLNPNQPTYKPRLVIAILFVFSGNISFAVHCMVGITCVLAVSLHMWSNTAENWNT